MMSNPSEPSQDAPPLDEADDALAQIRAGLRRARRLLDTTRQNLVGGDAGSAERDPAG
jgi:hypothetical protein